MHLLHSSASVPCSNSQKSFENYCLKRLRFHYCCWGRFDSCAQICSGLLQTYYCSSCASSQTGLHVYATTAHTAHSLPLLHSIHLLDFAVQLDFSSSSSFSVNLSNRFCESWILCVKHWMHFLVERYRNRGLRWSYYWVYCAFYYFSKFNKLLQNLNLKK